MPPRFFTPMPWAAEAACKGRGDLFFPSKGDKAAVRQAKAICASCPVQAECATHAVDMAERHGIWGGTSPKDRRVPGRRPQFYSRARRYA